ncbi:phage terminase large subunit family protein [Halomonas denitrificans]|uniref:phage terminase large subunit family protein n=1 Tax=Halomonas denitrificans TaxID=370769 RepID=UPI001CD2876C|nr:phage terminase large subunit family protein [Halomonas denitrificans]MCA0973439.1 phage terminase large subunit family protein [Halomonas denitrificans]
MDSEIKIVNAIYKDGGDYMIECPHCGEWMIVEGDDTEEIRGEQYVHTDCDDARGWLEVADTARYAGRVAAE